MSRSKRPDFLHSTVIFLVCTSLAACAAREAQTPTPAPADLETEEQAVYTAAFDEIFGEPRMYVLMAETSPGIQGVEGLDQMLEPLPVQMEDLEQETLENFRARNDAAYRVSADMELDLPYVLMTTAEMNEIFDVNTSGWDVFYTRYPNSPGITTISRIGFNNDLTQALVYCGTTSHWLGGAGFYLLLDRSSGTWQVIQQVMAWIS